MDRPAVGSHTRQLALDRLLRWKMGKDSRMVSSRPSEPNVKGGAFDLFMDVPVYYAVSNWVFALRGGERERAYGRLKRLSLVSAVRGGFDWKMARAIAEYDDARTRDLVGTLTAAAGLPNSPTAIMGRHEHHPGPSNHCSPRWG